MNDQFSVFDPRIVYRAIHHQQDYRNVMDTTDSGSNIYGTHPVLHGRIPDESQKLTSAALRSPVMSSFDKQVGGLTTHCTDNERVGEPPQPTPPGYEHCRYHKQVYLKKHQSQKQQNIAWPSSNALPVQQQYPTRFWQSDSRSSQVLCKRIDDNSPIQQYSHTSLFSTPPSRTVIQQNMLLSSKNSPVSDSSHYPVTYDPVNTTVRTCTIRHHHQQQRQVIYDNFPVDMTTASWSNIINLPSSASSTHGDAPAQVLPTSDPDNSNNNNTVMRSPIEKQTNSPISLEKSIIAPPFENEDGTEQNLRPRENNSVKLLSESLSYTMAIASHPPRNPRRYAVAKISNIPWNASIHDIEHLFKNPELSIKLPSNQETAQCIHIIIDKSSGKTLSEAYVEFESEKDINKVLRKLKTPHVKTRRVYITRSSPEQLFRAVFPHWRGIFIDGVPSIVNEQDHQQTPAFYLSTTTTTTTAPPPFVEGYEYDSLLAVCRNFKLHFSRKCAERPFENFISMIVKFPWDNPRIITTMQRDHLYEYYKLATGVLHNHLSKPNIQIDRTLMPRMVRAAIMCIGLTIPQKRGILIASDILCPIGLVHLIEPTFENELSSTNASLDERQQGTNSTIPISLSEHSISENAC